jgi:hypothetical protein
MSDVEFIALARTDRTWREIAASFAIEGLVLTEANEIVAGRMIAGQIDLPSAIRIIRESADLCDKA